jgi:hypothetical protein
MPPAAEVLHQLGGFITVSCVCARLAVNDRPNEVLTAVTVFFVLLLCVTVNVSMFRRNILLPSSGLCRDSNPGSPTRSVVSIATELPRLLYKKMQQIFFNDITLSQWWHCAARQ